MSNSDCHKLVPIWYLKQKKNKTEVSLAYSTTQTLNAQWSSYACTIVKITEP